MRPFTSFSKRSGPVIFLVSFLSLAKPAFFFPKMLFQEPVGGVTRLRDGASIFYIHSFNIGKGLLVLFLCSPVSKVAQ